jgi:HAD superfamily hydrolase (TIGR01509 family)
LIRGIVFDLFDTLVDQDPTRLALVEHEGRRLNPSTTRLHAHATRVAGLDVSLSEFAAIQREVDTALRGETLEVGVELASVRRFTALATRLGLSEVDQLGESWTRIHMDVLREAVTVPAHHEAILMTLALDYRLGVCSNFSHADTARAILEEAGLDRHLTTIVVSDEVGIRKPRPEIFEAVAESLALGPSEILHVGDSLQADVAGAARAGMRSVWLTRRVRDPEAQLAAFDGPRPDFALEDLMDLPVLAARLARVGGHG